MIERFINYLISEKGLSKNTVESYLFDLNHFKEFLDFEQKYLDFSRTHTIETAPINEKLTEMLEEAFKRLYDPLFAGALVRCDFFVKDGKIFINEINPIPGSLANYLFEDFICVVNDLAKSLPKNRKIRPDYAYIERVQSAKGPKTRYSS